MIEFVNEQGYSVAVCETPAIIERYRNTQGMFEVPLCQDFFFKRRWIFEKELWQEGATPEEIDIKKQIEIEKLKEMQFQELSETDWYVIRKIDIGTPIPEEILQQRQQIRDKYNELNNK